MEAVDTFEIKEGILISLDSNENLFIKIKKMGAEFYLNSFELNNNLLICKLEKSGIIAWFTPIGLLVQCFGSEKGVSYDSNSKKVTVYLPDLIKNILKDKRVN